jgi:hypothetical protein
MGEWRCSSSILNLSGRWWIISFTPLPLYLPQNNVWYSLYRRLGGSQNLTPWPNKSCNIPQAAETGLKITFGILFPQFLVGAIRETLSIVRKHRQFSTYREGRERERRKVGME